MLLRHNGLFSLPTSRLERLLVGPTMRGYGKGVAYRVSDTARIRIRHGYVSRPYYENRIRIELDTSIWYVWADLDTAHEAKWPTYCLPKATPHACIVYIRSRTACRLLFPIPTLAQSHFDFDS